MDLDSDYNQIKEEPREPAPAPGKPLWKRLLKWLGITVGALAGLFVLVCALIVWILTPARLTPLVEEQAGKFIDGTLDIERVELTFWRSFPHLIVEVDSLVLTSGSRAGLPDSVAAKLPADASKLLSIRSFKGGVNVPALLVGKISLYDVAFTGPRVNLVQATDSVANFDIFPPSAPDEAPRDEGPLSIPKITINSFSITDAVPVRYVSVPDSLDVAVSLRNMSLEGSKAPFYALSIDGGVASPLLEEFDFKSVGFSALGNLTWDASDPLSLAVENLELALDEFRVRVNATVDASESPLISELRARAEGLSVERIARHVPRAYASLAEPLKTDMEVGVTFSLTAPWNMADSVPPSFIAAIEIPRCAIQYENARIDEFEAMLTARYDGVAPDDSEFELEKLRVKGLGVDLSLEGVVSRVVSDPKVKGKFNGRLDFGAIPPRLAAQLPVELSGVVEGNADFNLAASDFSGGRFHRANIAGDITLRRFLAEGDSIGRAFVELATLDFGTNGKFLAPDGAKVDSLLQVSFKVDSLSYTGMGMDVEARGFIAGAGTMNRGSSADTTEINPFGFRIAVDRLKFDSPADTLRARLRDASIAGALRRYKGDAKVPQMGLRVEAGMMFLGQSLTKVAMLKSNMDLTVHMRPSRRMAVADSIVAKTRAQAAARRPDSAAIAAATAGNIDLRLDEKERSLLRRWDFSGRVTARRGRLVTPYFPLDNRLSHIDLRFNSDSVVLSNLSYRAGRSDFLVNGTISNLRRALTSRRGNTIRVSLGVRSDTINVNEIVQALFAGPALAQQADSAMVWNDSETDDGGLAQMADTVATGPLLVPRNVEATLGIRADNILYSDLALRDFRGDVMVFDGAVNLRDLSASTDIGSVAVDGLYSAPNADDLQFGLGMKVRDFRLNRLESLIPAIDSLLPALKSFGGIVNADVAVTTDLMPNMDIDIPSLKAAIKIEGDSLVLLDPETFKTVSKWLLFKNKKNNMIDHMAVEVVIENSNIELYPFRFDIDRYRLGVMGHNDLAMNMNYHVSVLKSPVPFKFGINIKGTPDKMKIRLGGAKFKDRMVVERQAIADTTRVNLVQQIDRVFRSGISKARLGKLEFPGADRGTAEAAAGGASAPTRSEGRRKRLDRASDVAAPAAGINGSEALTPTDSLIMIKQGMIDNPGNGRFPLSSRPPEVPVLQDAEPRKHK